MLQVGQPGAEIKAWICLRPPAALDLPEHRRCVQGDHALGFLDSGSADGRRFCIRYSVPDTLHDYAIRAVVDGKYKAARALSHREAMRDGGIASVPCSRNGEKAQHFVFDLNEGPLSPKKLFKGGSESSDSSSLSLADLTVGTIKLTFNRCRLEEIIVGSEACSSVEKTPKASTNAKPTHRTKLGNVQFEAPRKAYRTVHEEKDAWCTFTWIYGFRSFIESLPLGETEVEVSPHKRSLQDIHLQEWFGLKPDGRSSQEFAPPTIALHRHSRSLSSSLSKPADTIAPERRASLTHRLSMSFLRRSKRPSVDERSFKVFKDTIRLESIDSIPTSPSSIKGTRA